MALIKCPECGSQISDKAVKCPHCSIDVQKVLAEIREMQRLQQKKRRKRIIISIISVFVVGTIAVLAYLYSIDGLNSIPSDYRKLTENYFEQCESAIGEGDIDKGISVLDWVKYRTLTNRQTKRFEEIKNTLAEIRLMDLENRLATIQNDGDTSIDNEFFDQTRKDIAILNAAQLNTSQAKRFQKVKTHFLETQLAEVQRLVGLYETNPKEILFFTQINRIAKNLQNGELSTDQKSCVEDAINNAERIKKQEEDRCHEQLLITIRDEYVEIINGFLYDSGGSYFLYDINGDEIPELWVKTGEYEAEYRLLVYIYDNGIRLLYSDDAGHTDYCQGNGYIIEFYGHMGYATWKKLTYNGSSITSTIIYEEDINGTDRDYREPEEKYISFYSLNNKQPILNAFKAGL